MKICIVHCAQTKYLTIPALKKQSAGLTTLPAKPEGLLRYNETLKSNKRGIIDNHKSRNVRNFWKIILKQIKKFRSNVIRIVAYFKKI